MSYTTYYIFINHNEKKAYHQLSWMQARSKFNLEVLRKEIGHIEKVNCSVIRGDKVIASYDREDELPARLPHYT